MLVCVPKKLGKYRLGSCRSRGFGKLLIGEDERACMEDAGRSAFWCLGMVRCWRGYFGGMDGTGMVKEGGKGRDADM
jgi:hypothetical protein